MSDPPYPNEAPRTTPWDSPNAPGRGRLEHSRAFIASTMGLVVGIHVAPGLVG